VRPLQPVRITDSGEEGFVLRFMPRCGLYLVSLRGRMGETRMVLPDRLETLA
jgi:hypothetical protein